jgi:NADH-quinone oxidoreductase subunit N
VSIPDISWAAISPELVLFGAGILILLLDIAGPKRVSVSFSVLVAGVAAAVLGGFATGAVTIPALAVLAAAGQFALTVIWRDRPRMLGAILCALGFAAGFAATVAQWSLAMQGGLIGVSSTLAGMVAVDGVTLFTRLTVCLSGFVTVLLSYAYADERRMHRGEYYPLLLFAATGMTLLASAADLIMVFIAIEVLSLALYVLAAFAKRDLSSQESALKYFLLGAFSTAILLYGVALAYGVTGSTSIGEVGTAFAALDAPRGLTLTAMAMLLVGFGFKTAIVPFHMWTPDVYQGAPTPVTGFMAAATKAAAFAAFVRVFVGAFWPLQWSWVPVFWFLAFLTMLVGAIVAVVQTDMKRILGYSAITHTGFVLIGLIAATPDGVSATLFYLLVYAFMSLGSFGVLTLLEVRSHKALAIDDLRGLGRRYPIPAGMMAVFLLALAGIPGTAGFMAKLSVFRAAVAAGHSAIVVVAVIASVIAAFFYIRVIVAMFMEDEPAGASEQPPLRATPGTSAGLALTTAAVVVLGVVPGALVDLARQAATIAG